MLVLRAGKEIDFVRHRHSASLRRAGVVFFARPSIIEEKPLKKRLTVNDAKLLAASSLR